MTTTQEKECVSEAKHFRSPHPNDKSRKVLCFADAKLILEHLTYLEGDDWMHNPDSAKDLLDTIHHTNEFSNEELIYVKEILKAASE